MSRITNFSAIALFLSLLFQWQPAMAGERVEAYLLVTTSASLEAIQASTSGLSNCKALYESLAREIIVHVRCNNLTDLNRAITDTFAEAEEISQLTVFKLVKSGESTHRVMAYLLVTTSASLESVKASTSGLSNCKALYERLAGEIMVHVACNNLADLNRAITDKFAKAEEISQITISKLVEH